MGFDDFGLKLSDFGLNFWHFGLKIGKNVKISGLYIKFLKIDKNCHFFKIEKVCV